MSTQTMTRLIAEYFKTQPVLKAWLFGSYARGEETPESDVDILFTHVSALQPFHSRRDVYGFEGVIRARGGFGT